MKRQLIVIISIGMSMGAVAALPSYRCERLRVKADDLDVRPAAVNSRGEIVGTVRPDAPPDAIAYRWGKNLGASRLTRRKRESYASALNDAGQVVGTAVRKDGRVGALTWVDGVELELQDLPGPHRNSYAFGVNNAGQIAGKSLAGGKRWHAVVWDQGSIVELVDPNDEQDSDARHINDDGLIVGVRTVDEFHSHATSWDHGVMTDLGVLDGGARSVASASNSHGLIVGISNIAGGEPWLYRAVAWRSGVITDLGLLTGAQAGYASAVNDTGTIVGASEAFPASRTAVVWFDGAPGPVDLNSLLIEGGCTAADGSSVKLEWAAGVNRHGQIAAYGVAEKSIGFRLTPQ
ncbi:hypothetical protein [Ideonella sp.]|uniref:hypothetical protein n=1 Tax=Ideonella sp. TaxID=1929293 RepID=UPI0035B225CD